MPLENQRLAQAIDHTKLMFGTGEDEKVAIARLCEEAVTNGFYAVCVRPRHLLQAKEQLKGTYVKVAVVIGFPPAKVSLKDELVTPSIGKIPTAQKLKEAQEAIAQGADELDWVISIADLKQDKVTGRQSVYEELSAIRRIADGLVIKVIIETDLLTPDEIVFVTQICAKTGMDMVKTSTGMVEGGQGATLENVELICETLENLKAPTGIKASGGIKTREKALQFLNAGVSRLGTSSGLAIISNTFVAADY